MFKILKSVQGLAFVLYDVCHDLFDHVRGRTFLRIFKMLKSVGCCALCVVYCDDVCLKHKCGRVLTMWKCLNKVLCCFGDVCCVLYLVCCVVICCVLCVACCDEVCLQHK